MRGLPFVSTGYVWCGAREEGTSDVVHDVVDGHVDAALARKDPAAEGFDGEGGVTRGFVAWTAVGGAVEADGGAGESEDAAEAVGGDSVPFRGSDGVALLGGAQGGHFERGCAFWAGVFWGGEIVLQLFWGCERDIFGC